MTLAPDSIGTLAGGRYSLLRPLPGAADSFLARDHEAFDRPVVIRRFAQIFGPAADQAARRRFLHRMQAQAAVRHPLTPLIYAYFQDGADAYVVLEPIAGRRLDAGPYPVADVAAWGLALCGLLEHLRGQRPPLGHGGIRPERLLLDAESGELRLDGLIERNADPADDLRDLAETLHQLSGADPALAELLADARDHVPARRPEPAALRRRLERLLLHHDARRLQAPDGALIDDGLELAGWLVRNWEPAKEWLYGALPDQVEFWWRRPELAAELRRAVEDAPDRERGLDAAIALLDPRGYGARLPDIQPEPPAISLGTFAEGEARKATLTVRNAGAAPARVSLNLPRWLTADTGALTIEPGATAAITLSASDTPARLGRWHDDVLQLRTPRGLPHTLPVRARAGRWRTAWRRRPIRTLLLCAALFWALSYAGVIGYASVVRQSSYAGATAAMAAGDLAEAERLIERALGHHGIFGPSTGRLVAMSNDVSGQQIGRLLAAGDIAAARQVLDRSRLGSGTAQAIALEQQLALAEGQLRSAAKLPESNLSDIRLAAVALSPDGTTLMGTRLSGVNTEVWSLADGVGSLAWLDGEHAQGTAIRADGVAVFISSRGVRWRGAQGWAVAELAPARLSTLSADGRVVARADGGGVAVFQTQASGVGVEQSHYLPLPGAGWLALSADGALLAAANGLGVHVYRLDGAGEQLVIPHSQLLGQAPRAGLLSADGAALVLLGAERALAYDLGRREPRAEQRIAGLSWDTPAALSPDGERLAVGLDGMLMVYDGRSLEPLIWSDLHLGRISGLAFSADGASLLTVDDSGDALVWDATRW